jgi:hypothetical protein
MKIENKEATDNGTNLYYEVLSDILGHKQVLDHKCY